MENDLQQIVQNQYVTNEAGKGAGTSDQTASQQQLEVLNALKDMQL